MVVGEGKLARVADHEGHSLPGGFFLLGEVFCGVLDPRGLNIDSHDLETLATQQDRNDPLAATHVEDTLALDLADHPVDPATSSLLSVVRPDFAFVDLRYPVVVHAGSFRLERP